MWLLETKSNWYHDIAGHQTKVNTSMEKYTAKQYAEMTGGHTVSEEKKSLNLGFIGSELTESRMFRSKGRVEGTSNRDMADLAFMNLIALYILYNEYDFAPAAKGYAKKTMQSGNFNNFRIGGTDLYMALNSLASGTSTARDKDQMQQARINLPEVKIKNFLNQMRNGRPITGPQVFFMNLERGLDIQNSNYRSVRRLAQDWPRLNTMQKQLVITRMLQYFRTNALRSELYSFIRDIARSQGLEVRNAHNAEKPKMRGSDTLARAAAMAAAGAGGFVAGRALGKWAVGGD